MKIALIVNPAIPVPPENYGGIERIVFMLIKELMKCGHDITLFAHIDSKVDCKLIGYAESEKYGAGDFIKINRLTSKINSQGFDLVHTFGRMSNIALLMLSGIPKIVSYQLPVTVSQVKKAIKLAKKKSLHFTACSNYIASQIKPFYPVTTIFNGVDTSEYDFKDSVSENAPLVFLGRIQEEKGTHLAIEIVKKAHKNLIIAGNIPNESIHQKYFKERVRPFIDQEQIRYIGPVNNQRKNELLKNAKALLMPVTWHEPFGIVMAEALACGTPVIGFNKGAVPEVVVDGVNGFVCNTTTEMINAVSQIELIDRNICRQIAVEKFNAPVLSRQYEELYRQVTLR